MIPLAASSALLALSIPVSEAGARTSPSPSRPLAAAGEGSAPAQPPLPVSVTVDPFAPGPPVPKRFLGLSFEMAALAQLAQYSERGDLVKLLRSLGPGMLRFGGITADENVAWTPPRRGRRGRRARSGPNR